MSKFPYPWKLCLFGTLSLADLSLTRYLLSLRGGAYESNPVAAWWLDQFGWSGLAGFKLATVALCVALVVIVSRRRPRAAGGVLSFGCLVLAGVVAYSAWLVPQARAESPQAPAVFQTPEEARVLAHRADEKMKWAAEVADGRLDLLAAASRFRHLDASNPTKRPRVLLVYPGRTEDERYCWQVLQFVETVVRERDMDPVPVLQALESELRAHLARGPIVLTQTYPVRPLSSDPFPDGTARRITD